MTMRSIDAHLLIQARTVDLSLSCRCSDAIGESVEINSHLQLVNNETKRKSIAAFHESVHSLPVQAREMVENTTAYRLVLTSLAFVKREFRLQPFDSVTACCTTTTRAGT